MLISSHPWLWSPSNAWHKLRRDRGAMAGGLAGLMSMRLLPGEGPTMRTSGSAALGLDGLRYAQPVVALGGGTVAIVPAPAGVLSKDRVGGRAKASGSGIRLTFTVFVAVRALEVAARICVDRGWLPDVSNASWLIIISYRSCTFVMPSVLLHLSGLRALPFAVSYATETSC